MFKKRKFSIYHRNKYVFETKTQSFSNFQFSLFLSDFEYREFRMLILEKSRSFKIIFEFRINFK